MEKVDWERGEVRPHSGFTRNLTASGGAHLRLHWVPDRPHLRPSLSPYVRYAMARARRGVVLTPGITAARAARVNFFERGWQVREQHGLPIMAVGHD